MRYRSLLFIMTVLLLFGCSASTMLPSTKTTDRSPWDHFEDAKAAFDQINPHETTYEDLKEFGFDPFKTPNMEILTYLDIMGRFVPNQLIQKEDLDEGIQECIEAKTQCRAYEITVEKSQSQRFGNALMDIFNFRRKTKTSGWGFKAIVVMNDGLVIYKLWGGKPIIDKTWDKKNPLGPLQESEGALKVLSPW